MLEIVANVRKTFSPDRLFQWHMFAVIYKNAAIMKIRPIVQHAQKIVMFFSVNNFPGGMLLYLILGFPPGQTADSFKWFVCFDWKQLKASSQNRQTI